MYQNCIIYFTSLFPLPSLFLFSLVCYFLVMVVGMFFFVLLCSQNIILFCFLDFRMTKLITFLSQNKIIFWDNKYDAIILLWGAIYIYLYITQCINIHVSSQVICVIYINIHSPMIFRGVLYIEQFWVTARYYTTMMLAPFA